MAMQEMMGMIGTFIMHPKLAFLMDLPARIFDAVADRLLVNIQPDVIHDVIHNVH
jgi:hypothetical protein